MEFKLGRLQVSIKIIPRRTRFKDKIFVTACEKYGKQELGGMFGWKIALIKAFRAETNCDLSTAKTWVENEMLTIPKYQCPPGVFAWKECIHEK